MPYPLICTSYFLVPVTGSWTQMYESYPVGGTSGELLQSVVTVLSFFSPASVPSVLW